MKKRKMTDPDDGPIFRLINKLSVHFLEALAVISVLGVIALCLWLFRFLCSVLFP